MSMGPSNYFVVGKESSGARRQRIEELKREGICVYITV